MSTQTTIDASIAAVGSKTTYAGAGATAAGWLLSSEFIGLCGILIALAGLVVNFFFRWRQDRREKIEHLARMKKLSLLGGLPE